MKLTQEQLAELIAKVFSNLDERRKACKEGEGAPGGFSTDDIVMGVATPSRASTTFSASSGPSPVTASGGA